jgi:uncharacterized protein YecT (DUF1311 family)
MRRGVLGLALLCLAVCPAQAQSGKPDARISADIQDCVKTKTGGDWESCIGMSSGPCLEKSSGVTAEMVTCIAREQAVWDDILNETFRRLRAKLDATQQTKLREMQRAWITSRDKTCAFYWDFFQGTMATPMSAECVNRETGRRALFLLGFLNDLDNK